eukprot:5318232-Prymnesium_polylepis.3
MYLPRTHRCDGKSAMRVQGGRYRRRWRSCDVHRVLEFRGLAVSGHARRGTALSFERSCDRGRRGTSGSGWHWQHSGRDANGAQP